MRTLLFVDSWNSWIKNIGRYGVNRMNSNERLEEIYNFLQLSDSIATAGQPNVEQFAAIKQAGYDVVVNLALPTSTNAIPNEREVVESQGMEYIHIPVVWENPTIEDANRFFQVIQANIDRKIFVHCAMNMRVSAFMYLYRCIHEQIDDEVAKQDLHKIWVPSQLWQTFIENVQSSYSPNYPLN